MGDPQPLGPLVAAELEDIRQASTRRIAALTQRVTSAGGVAAFLGQTAPTLLRRLPTLADLRPEALATGTAPAELEAAEARARECARCPADGGACAGVERRREPPPGQWPVWTADGLAYAPCDRWAAYALRQQLVAAGVGARFLDCRFATYEPQTGAQGLALAACATYAARFREAPEPGLLLLGPPGTGKTHLAVALAAALLAQGVDVRLEKVPQILAAIRASYGRPEAERDPRLARAVAARLLVLDDLGAERPTEWVLEQLYLLIDSRYEARRPLVVTTNDPPDVLAERLGARLTSRLYEMTRAVPVVGPDWRQRGGA